jgi:hypothetical protein
MPNVHTSEPLIVPEPTGTGYWRVDLIIDDVDHSGPTYEGRIYFDNPDAGEGTGRDLEAGYAGSFHVFGHAGCFGDEGHCDVPSGPRDPYDLRPPHQLVPHTKIITVTDALERRGGGEVTVTIVPIVRTDPDLPVDYDDDRVLRFNSLRLVAYE